MWKSSFKMCEGRKGEEKNGEKRQNRCNKKRTDKNKRNKTRKDVKRPKQTKPQTKREKTWREKTRQMKKRKRDVTHVESGRMMKEPLSRWTERRNKRERWGKPSFLYVTPWLPPQSEGLHWKRQMNGDLGLCCWEWVESISAREAGQHVCIWRRLRQAHIDHQLRKLHTDWKTKRFNNNNKWLLSTFFYRARWRFRPDNSQTSKSKDGQYIRQCQEQFIPTRIHFSFLKCGKFWWPGS